MSSASTKQTGEIIVCDFTKRGSWSSVRISRAIIFCTTPETGSYSVKQNQSSISGRRITSEKYYDCFQCAEECRHVSMKNNYNYNNSNKSSYSSTKNSYNDSITNCNKKFNNNNNINKVSKLPSTESKKINDILKERNNCFQTKKIEKKNEKICLVNERFLKSVPNHQTSKRQVLKNQVLNNQILNNQISNYKLSTPAKKRSSLARPVKVYDSFAPPKWMMGNDNDYPNNSFEDQERFEDSNPQIDLEPNANRAYFDARDEDSNWPIRLRLEELLDQQNKKKKRKGIATIRKSKIITADPGKNSFKDTERLLKVLSNHVDQDSRYNVKRCSVM